MRKRCKVARLGKRCNVARLGKHQMWYLGAYDNGYSFGCRWCFRQHHVPFRKFWKGKTWWQKVRKELAYQLWRRW